MINTVTGPIGVDEIGLALMHEHIITRSPGVAENYPETYPRGEVTDACVDLLRHVREQFGVHTIVDHSTIEMGRDPELLAEVSRQSGVQIVACTGLWIDPPMYFHQRSPDHAASLFIRDVTVGIAGTGIRAGVVKCAVDSSGITPPIEIAIRAAAITHRATGVPITSHTWTGNKSGAAVAKILQEEGVDMGRVVLGHSGDTEDIAYLESLLQTGAWLGMDRFGIEDRLPDAARVGVVAALCRAGYTDRLFLSQDVSCWSGRLTPEYKRSHRPNWYLWRLFDYVIPALLELGVSQTQIDTMLIDNPRTFFTRCDPY